MRDVQYVRPATLDELASMLANQDAMIVAGGTDLVVKMNDGSITPKLIVDISALDELNQIDIYDDHIDIGAAVTISDITENGFVAENLPILKQILSKLGSTQIRNKATLAGNIANASPAADGVVALILLDAAAQLVSSSGKREVAIADLITGPGETVLAPGEYISRISVPLMRQQATSLFRKVGRRKAMTIAIASVGMLLWMRNGIVEQIRLAAGSVAPTPVRLVHVEQALTGRKPDSTLATQVSAAVGKDISPISDIRASAGYREKVIGDLVVASLLDMSKSVT